MEISDEEESGTKIIISCLYFHVETRLQSAETWLSFLEHRIGLVKAPVTQMQSAMSITYCNILEYMHVHM